MTLSNNSNPFDSIEVEHALNEHAAAGEANRPAYPQEIVDILEAALKDDKIQQAQISGLRKQLEIANAENSNLWRKNDGLTVALNRQKELVTMIHTQLGNMAFNLNQSPNFIMDGVVRSLDSVMVYSKKSLDEIAALASERAAGDEKAEA